VDVLEQGGRLIVLVEVPGLPPEALKVAFRERTLVLSGDRRSPRVRQGARFQCLERPHGRFERTIPLDVPVDVANATARLAGGVLTIELPRLRERRGRETVIPIEWERSEGTKSRRTTRRSRTSRRRSSRRSRTCCRCCRCATS
jgi:HSP20 family protein